MVEDLKEGCCWKRYEITLERHSMLMNWKLLTALKLTKTLQKTVFVYTLNLFKSVIVLKLISDCLGFSGVFRWSVWVFSENPNGNTDYDDDVIRCHWRRYACATALSGTIFIVFGKYFKSK